MAAFDDLYTRKPIVHYHTYVIHVKYSESDATMNDGFYMSLASRLACATWARRCARSEFCVPWAPFFALCAFWVVGAVPACDSRMGVMSDAKPGIRIL